MDLTHVKGIGEKYIELLYKANIYSVEDLVSYYPYKYQLYEPEVLENSLDGVVVTINAKVFDNPKVSYIRKNFNALRFTCETYGKVIKVTIFNRAYLKPHLIIGKEITLIGKYNSKTNTFTANDMKLSKIEDKKIVPVYHLIKGIKNSVLTKMIENALKEINTFEKVLPKEVEEEHHFLSKKESLENIHHPKEMEFVKKSRERMIYEELFEFMFKIQYLKKLKEQEVGISKSIDLRKVEEFIKTLPFTLTGDQRGAIQDGLQDMIEKKRMNRLLLGDVGSGKTIVATVLMYANTLAGYQSAFLAPTEVLATQHYYSIVKLLKETPYSVELLVGSMTKKEKENIHKRVQNHEIDILIGTHAILNEHLFFDNLGFVVTDEQHRFGVNQRDLLKEKGMRPDMLFMSATPIPRTYALTIYGDMDTSMIKEKPVGRKDVLTKVLPESELKTALLKVLEEIKQNHQVYVVAPMIEENTENDLKDVYLLKERFQTAFHGKVPVEVLHGKMKKDEKQAVMNDFKNGDIKILIATTVIEVGVDVKNATVMLIFNAERFGLATLHQLRGRVGRSELQSYCYFICKEVKERLKVLEESNDGFYISEKDFEFRGEGDLFGVKQSGDMTFQMANLKRDYEILLEMKEKASVFISKEEYLSYPYFTKIVQKIDFRN